ncbi:hypothetical protein A2870_03450 [Candidatus Curtissbacteria bacterium RIFCSPHIGHO2_01_FULL_41_11]|uniref:LytR/CpsA/Psr regulator C-terminal domain-containing protein n=1 Tax=Candidatus Curtissbacteria bacterium RIFCSPHIGHO2_01_FULL_41_11 TaxID=1797711 RepID=A0A1F5G5R0_9BACT|nr:MAG: hypothetical protein A2870_03450 [Candidatus Curtissbacteria bacterium RIFCSPHIGHO2_01_FULL_41_11]
MTDYSKKRTAAGNQESLSKWHNFLAVFVLVTLIFALISGIGKTITLGRILGTSRWDGISSISAIQNTNPPTVLIWQSYPKRLVVVKLDPDVNVPTGNIDEPVGSLKSLFENATGDQMRAIVLSNIHIPITNYLFWETDKDIGEEKFKDDFKSFASFVTPFKIIFGETEEGLKTDFAQKDLIKLWWQSKSLSLGEIEFIDTGNMTEDIVLPRGQKVKGIDEYSVQALLSKYMENRKILEGKEKIVIENASGVAGAGKLASDLVGAVGATVSSVEVAPVPIDKSSVRAEKSYTSVYLAKVFDCDITSGLNEDRDMVKIIVGRDFADRFLL